MRSCHGQSWRPVILHTDHAARKLLPQVDGMLDAGEKFHEREGKPLWLPHADLSEEPIEDNFKRQGLFRENEWARHDH